MRKLSILFLTILFFSVSFAQSGRQTANNANSPETEAIKALTVEEMFTKATNYALDKFTELDKSGQSYSETVHKKILREQKQLAAKYASEASSREGLAGVDFYYLGRLHWMATNGDDASDAFKTFLAIPSNDGGMLQTARAVVVFISADGKDFETAEKMLAEYIKDQPIRTTELAKMQKQMAHSYQLEKEFELAAPHADGAFMATKKILFEEGSRALALNMFLDAGVTSFEIQKHLKNQTKAEEILETMRKYAVNVKSHSVYFRAVDEQIKYRIDTDRKPSALELYKTSLKQVEQDFEDVSLRNYVKQKLKKREPHYDILGEAAPELVSIDQWLPNTPQKLENFRGKVVLLDFWATWCGPCLAAFPSLIEWHNDLRDDGLVILGMTRYYQQNNGGKNSKSKEIDFLSEFKTKFKLPYSFVVSDGQQNQMKYGAMSIPTAVLIDRRGIVRFIESGSSESREKEIHKKILELLAED